MTYKGLKDVRTDEEQSLKSIQNSRWPVEKLHSLSSMLIAVTGYQSLSNTDIKSDQRKVCVIQSLIKKHKTTSEAISSNLDNNGDQGEYEQ